MHTATNYNKKRLNFSDTLKEFEQQIKNLVSDLDNYKQKENHNKKYVFYKQQQINSLKDTLFFFYEFKENTDLQMINYSKEKAQLNNKIFKLEGICLYHGIWNLNYYLRMEKDILIKNVQRAFKEGWIQTPVELLPETTPKERNESKISHLITKAKQLNINGK